MKSSVLENITEISFKVYLYHIIQEIFSKLCSSGDNLILHTFWRGYFMKERLTTS